MRILLASAVHADAERGLRERHDVITLRDASEDELARAIVDREALVFRSGVAISRRVLDAAPDLRLLIRAGSGLDNLDLDTVRARGITLHRIPGPGAQAVAEMTFALLLSLLRNVVVADRTWREGRWLKAELVGHGVRGKTLGVVGLGSIGTTVARLAKAWEMTVVGCVERYSEERRSAFAADGIELLPDCGEVLARADFVSVHLPLDEATRGIIDAAALARMRPGSFLVNIARGGVVDEAALGDALRSGRLAGAALDVHEREGNGKVSPLADLDNVVLTPHLGASTVDAQREIGQIVVELVDAFAPGHVASPGDAHAAADQAGGGVQHGVADPVRR